MNCGNKIRRNLRGSLCLLHSTRFPARFIPTLQFLIQKALHPIHGTSKMIRSSICRNLPFPWLWSRVRVSANKPSLPSDNHVRSLFTRFHYSSTAKSRNPVADYLITRHQFSIAAASEVSSQICRIDSFDRSDSVLNWLKEIGFSQNQVESVVSRVPTVLSTDLSRTLKPKYRVFKDLGFPSSEFAEIIAIDPWLLVNRSAIRIASSLQALMSVLGSLEDVTRALKICTWFLKTDLDKSLLVNIEFLQEKCSVNPLQIRRFLFNFPRLLLSQPEQIRSVARRVDEMGFGDRSSGMFLHAVRAMASLKIENWEAKLEFFRSLGLSEEDISSIFRKSPQLFTASEMKIREMVDLLVGQGKGDMALIVRHPGLLMFSAERRIKPRMLLLDLLEEKNLIRKRPCLSALCKLSNRYFLGKYVLPYSDVLGDTCLIDKLQ